MKRNTDRLRQVLQEMINDRRQNKTKSSDEHQNDLLGILISTEFYAQDDNFIIDELITFFAAGMKTI